MLSWSRVIVAIGGATVITATVAAGLPDNEYERYQLLAHTIQSRIVWVYERTQFDPTPIDVVIIGPSRTSTGISGPALEAGLARRGRDETAVNFSAPENGRDLHWVIFKQVMATKTPKVLVIGIVDNPSRSGHPAYKYIARSEDVIDPGFLFNRDYISNLVYLPYRQMLLFAARYFPQVFGLTEHFERKSYRGSNFDSTLSYRSGTGRWVEREREVPAADLERNRRAYESWANLPSHDRRFADIEFGNERTYVRRIAKLAQARGIRIVFLFLPYYRGTSIIQERPFYERYGPILDASFLSTHAEWFSDIAHLNHSGALVVTDWLAARIAGILAQVPPDQSHSHARSARNITLHPVSSTSSKRYPVALVVASAHRHEGSI